MNKEIKKNKNTKESDFYVNEKGVLVLLNPINQNELNKNSAK